MFDADVNKSRELSIMHKVQVCRSTGHRKEFLSALPTAASSRIEWLSRSPPASTAGAATCLCRGTIHIATRNTSSLLEQPARIVQFWRGLNPSLGGTIRQRAQPLRAAVDARVGAARAGLQWRLMWLLEYGGVYVDSDVEPMVPLERPFATRGQSALYRGAAARATRSNS